MPKRRGLNPTWRQGKETARAFVGRVMSERGLRVNDVARAMAAGINDPSAALRYRAILYMYLRHSPIETRFGPSLSGKVSLALGLPEDTITEIERRVADAEATARAISRIVGK